MRVNSQVKTVKIRKKPCFPILGNYLLCSILHMIAGFFERNISKNRDNYQNHPPLIHKYTQRLVERQWCSGNYLIILNKIYYYLLYIKDFFHFFTRKDNYQRPVFIGYLRFLSHESGFYLTF